MTPLRLNDPARHPPDWSDHLKPGQCAVFLSDIATGEELRTDGQPRNGAPAQCYVFNSLADAKAFCISMVDQFDNVHAEVFDQRGRAVNPLFSHMHPTHAAKLPSEESIRRRLRLSWILMIPSPFLFWWDYRHQLVLILPTFIGINLIIVGLRIRMWATGEREALRERAKETPNNTL